MPPAPLPFIPESVSAEQARSQHSSRMCILTCSWISAPQVALLSSPKVERHTPIKAEPHEPPPHRVFRPVDRLSAIARSPVALLLVTACTMLAVLLLFLLRRSVLFERVKEVPTLATPPHVRM